MLGGKIFEKKAKNHLGGGIPSPDVTRVKIINNYIDKLFRITLSLSKFVIFYSKADRLIHNASFGPLNSA